MTEGIKTILVVDAEAEISKAIGRHLTRKGFSLITASDSDSARRKIETALPQKKFPDLLIIDIAMPTLDGLELIKWLKKNRAEISVLAIFGFGAIDAVLETIRPELDDYCQKPLTPEKMMAVINNIAQKRRNFVVSQTFGPWLKEFRFADSAGGDNEPERSASFKPALVVARGGNNC